MYGPEIGPYLFRQLGYLTSTPPLGAADNQAPRGILGMSAGLKQWMFNAQLLVILT